MKTLLAFLILFTLTLVVLADEPAPATQIVAHVVATPAAAHPQAYVKSIDATTHTVCFDWLTAEGAKADSGNSVATYNTANESQPPTDAELIAAITAAAPAN